MGIRPQNRIPRLAIVGPTDKKPRQHPAGQRWWGPPRCPHLDHAIQVPPKPYRMTVMPALPRSISLIVLAWTWNFLRGYFATETPRKRGAVVLSFQAMARHCEASAMRWRRDSPTKRSVAVPVGITNVRYHRRREAQDRRDAGRTLHAAKDERSQVTDRTGGIAC